MTIPEPVRNAVERSGLLSSNRTARTSEGLMGDLAIAVAGEGRLPRRVVAVVGLDESTKTLVVHLTTNVVESATDLDLIVEKAESGPPCDLVLQGELYGPVFTEQLQDTVGRIEESYRSAISQAVITDGESLIEFHTGLPLGSPGDPRRRFKERELDDLEGLVEECRQWMSGAPASEEMLDPEMLLPPPVDTPLEVATEMYLELLDTLNGLSRRDLSSELLAMLNEVGLLDELRRWRTDFHLDVVRILDRLPIVEAPTEIPSVSYVPVVTPEARATDAILEPLLSTRADVGQVVVDIHTTARRWRRGREPIIASSESGRYCRGRARIREAA